MPGFPNRIGRTSLGPALQDTWPVTDPTKAIPAQSFMLAWWQLAGASLVVPRAVIGVTMSGTDPVTTYQAIAFDPDGLLPLLEWTRNVAGSYSYSFPDSEYPDEAGNLVTVSFVGGQAVPQALISGGIALGHHERTGPRAGTVRIYSGNPLVLTEMSDGTSFLVTLM
jgi:hypothetical protein